MAIQDKTHTKDWAETYQADAKAAAFLKKHPFLVEALYNALPHLHRHFGEALDIRLEMTEEDFIFANIWTNEEADAALAKLDKFDYDYLLELDAEIVEHLNFNLRYA